MNWTTVEIMWQLVFCLAALAAVFMMLTGMIYWIKYIITEWKRI